jgi:hypothetical protein
MKRMLLTLAALALLGGTGCGMESPTAPPPPKTVALNEDFELAAGQTGVVGESGLSVVFERVGSDSRCAVDVTCVWEGDAAVELRATATGQPEGKVDLHTSTQMGSRQGRYLEFTITLQNVNPQPRSQDRIKDSAYRVTLRVTR